MSLNLEFNKLLVPSPVATINDQGTSVYAQPDVNFLRGIFESFNDAEDGFLEELKEITWAAGLSINFKMYWLYGQDILMKARKKEHEDI